jgi:alkanesulfonate monooxygenase SsuD/methylene tetrahydromethanopterin reductase-like flavin-dependent oxidoreductase (luciferase family)
VFVVADDADGMRTLRAELRERARAAGRDPDRLKVLPAIQPVAAATDEEAAAHLAGMTALLDPAETLRYLARLLHAEHLDPDAPGADAVEAHRGATGSTGFEDMLIRACRRESLTVQQLADRQAVSQLGPLPTGSPQTIADELCGLVETGAADGFVVMASVYPDSFDRFVEHVVPELQRRGHLRRDYAGSTLREHLGLR